MSGAIKVVVKNVEALCEMLVQGWNVENPSNYKATVTIESMRSVKMFLTNQSGSGDDLNVYIANGKTYVSKSSAPDETVTLYGVWLPDQCNAANKDSMLVPLELLSPDVSVNFDDVIKAIREQKDPVTKEEMKIETRSMADLLRTINFGITLLPKQRSMTGITELLSNINSGIDELPTQSDVSALAQQVSKLLTTTSFDTSMSETNKSIKALQDNLSSLQRSFSENNATLQAAFKTDLDSLGQTVAVSMANMAALNAELLQDTQQAQKLKTAAQDAATKATKDAKDAKAAQDSLGTRLVDEEQERQRVDAEKQQRQEEENSKAKLETKKKAREDRQFREQQRVEAEKSVQQQRRAKIKAKRKAAADAMSQRQRDVETAIEEAEEKQPDDTARAGALFEILKDSEDPKALNYAQQLITFINITDSNSEESYKTVFTVVRNNLLPWFENFVFGKALDIDDVMEQNNVLRNAWFEESPTLATYRYASKQLLKCVTTQNYFFDELRISTAWEGTIQTMQSGTLLYKKCSQLKDLVKWCENIINANINYNDKQIAEIERYVQEIENLYDSNETLIRRIMNINAALQSINDVVTILDQERLQNADKQSILRNLPVNKITWFAEYVLRWHCETLDEKIAWLEEVEKQSSDAYKYFVVQRLRYASSAKDAIKDLKQARTEAFNEGPSTIDQQYELTAQIEQKEAEVQSVLFPAKE